jgi:hypothetical protein
MIALGRADSSQCAPKDQNYAARQGTPRPCGDATVPFQRHSLSMSPKDYVSFFRLCVVSLCVFSVVVVARSYYNPRSNKEGKWPCLAL